MEPEKIFNSKNVKTIAVIAIFFAILAVFTSLMQTPKYQSSSRILVVFKQEKIDPYFALKTSEYLTGILGEIIYSTSFLDSVIKSQFGLKDELGFSQKTRQKNWEKMIQVETDNNRGLIRLDVFHPDKDQANRFAEAVIYSLATKHSAYHGLGNSVELKVIDQPTVSEGRARPRIVLNAFLGAIIGLAAGLALVVLFPEQKILEFVLHQTQKKLIGDETIELSAENEPEPNEAAAMANASFFEEPNCAPAETTRPNQYYDW